MEKEPIQYLARGLERGGERGRGKRRGSWIYHTRGGGGGAGVMPKGGTSPSHAQSHKKQH